MWFWEWVEYIDAGSWGLGGLRGGAKEARKEKRSGIQDEAMEGKPKIDRQVSSHVLLGMSSERRGDQILIAIAYTGRSWAWTVSFSLYCSSSL